MHIMSNREYQVYLLDRALKRWRLEGSSESYTHARLCFEVLRLQDALER